VPAAATRVVFVDLLRFVAALQMLQGHTIAALLAPEHREGAAFALWSAARGLTSVGFLFAAGLAFYLATERTAALGAGRRAARALRLIALGYLLHLPLAAAFTSDPAARERALSAFVAVDVLQCIGVSMLLLEGLRALLPRPAWAALASAALALACFALTPLCEALDLERGPRALLAYLTPQAGSIFPLPPWAAHVLAGMACAALIRAPGRLAPSARLGLLALAGFALHAACARWLESRSVVDHVQRLAWVLFASAVLAALGERLPRVPRLVQALASQTLFLYVFHVLLVYGDGIGLASWIGPRLSPLGAVGAAALVVLLSAGVALAFDRRFAGRRARDRLARARGTG
jgi:Heparan-alpha-glucosaminide N-acetyltransferase, catalytic